MKTKHIPTANSAVIDMATFVTVPCKAQGTPFILYLSVLSSVCISRLVSTTALLTSPLLCCYFRRLSWLALSVKTESSACNAATEGSPDTSWSSFTTRCGGDERGGGGDILVFPVLLLHIPKKFCLFFKPPNFRILLCYHRKKKSDCFVFGSVRRGWVHTRANQSHTFRPGHFPFLICSAFTMVCYIECIVFPVREGARQRRTPPPPCPTWVFLDGHITSR